MSNQPRPIGGSRRGPTGPSRSVAVSKTNSVRLPVGSGTVREPSTAKYPRFCMNGMEFCSVPSRMVCVISDDQPLERKILISFSVVQTLYERQGQNRPALAVHCPAAKSPSHSLPPPMPHEGTYSFHFFWSNGLAAVSLTGEYGSIFCIKSSTSLLFSNESFMLVDRHAW